MSDVAASEAPKALLSQEKILFIDDEKNVLLAIHRQLRKSFNILPALGGEEALKLLEVHKPAVVVCDMRMPGMDGVSTLEEFEKRSPSTVRIMLTGNADQQTAIEAINRGHIFRFLNKPCSEETLRQALIDALHHHDIITAEKNLLEQTVTGSIRAIVDVLSLVAPQEFARASRAARWARPLAKALNLQSPWELEVAAMLYPLGLVAVPAQVLEKMHTAPKTLSAKEAAIIAQAPESARRLLMHIPRLNGVAEAISLQNRGYDGSGTPDNGPSGDKIPIIARALKVLKDVAEESQDDIPHETVINKLLSRGIEYDLRILAAAQRLWSAGPGPDPRKIAAAVPVPMSVSLDALLPNDLLLKPITFAAGKLLLSEGIRVTAAQIERLRNLRNLEKINEPIEIQR